MSSRDGFNELCNEPEGVFGLWISSKTIWGPLESMRGDVFLLLVGESSDSSFSVESAAMFLNGDDSK